MERGCLNNLIQTDNGSDAEARIERVVKMLLAGEYEDIPVGALADGTPYRISEYDTQDAKDCIIESHRNHIDVQFVISGSEWINLYADSGLTSVGEYNAEVDAEFWQDGIIESRTIMRPGSIKVIKENGIIKLFEGLSKFLRVCREGQALFLVGVFEGLV